MRRFAEAVSKGTPTRVAIIKHPVHPMLVTFPIAFLIAVLASDCAYLFTADPFWARVSLWLVASGTVAGALASLAGIVELLSVWGIRRRPAGWSHFTAAIMLLAVATANWLMRIDAPASAILPWGVYLSALGVLLVAFAGWLGGHLVFKHQVGVGEEGENEP